ncbi:hypothetical protein STEG23_036993, partial [Scotinomys teguina]
IFFENVYKPWYSLHYIPIKSKLISILKNVTLSRLDVALAYHIQGYALNFIFLSVKEIIHVIIRSAMYRGQIFGGNFVKANRASVNIPRIVRSYVAGGYPTVKWVNDLIYRLGYGNIRKKLLALTDKALIA